MQDKDLKQRLYILGWPVAHSKSPAMYNAVYETLRLPWVYGFMPIESPQDARDFIIARDYISINITTPHKQVAFECADGASLAAQLAQGANVLVNSGGRLIADNTDGAGCISYLARCGADFPHARVCICGTGPTARAIMHAAIMADVHQLMILGRDAARAQTVVVGYLQALRMVAGDYGVAGVAGAASDDASAGAGETAGSGQAAGDGQAVAGSQVADSDQFAAAGQTVQQAQAALGRASQVLSAADYEGGQEALAQADIIIDATSLGMKPDDPAPFDTRLLHAGQLVFDVVYGHGTTALIKAAQEAGTKAIDGEGMLVAQAVETVNLLDRLGLIMLDESGGVPAADQRADGARDVGQCADGALEMDQNADGASVADWQTASQCVDGSSVADLQVASQRADGSFAADQHAAAPRIATQLDLFEIMARAAGFTLP